MAQNFVDVGKTKEEQIELLKNSGFSDTQARQASGPTGLNEGHAIIDAPLAQEAVIVSRPGADGNVSISKPQKELKA